jgi:1-aminocyclopropane-1-carboxylate deaminase/D-cysteine desulfhydrase-like pyridoxal-dependent ACC family enzyme
VAELPLLRRFPALSGIPRAALGQFPTPVSRVELGDGRGFWVKRDDLSGATIGGNKVRALEWLLGRVRPGDEVLTVGPRGSSHALATAHCAQRLGANTTVVRWNQEMNPAARSVSNRIADVARLVDVGSVVAAYVAAGWIRLRSNVRWIPAGGTTPLGILGYVNGALELAEQIERGECPKPDEVIVPLGTGGTVAGIALGLRITGLRCRVRAVRVAPRIIASGGRIARLIQSTRHLMEAVTRAPVPSPWLEDLVVESHYYGGGYGRPIAPSANEAALGAMGIRLDDTYSRKAFTAVHGAGGVSLFWLTFDGRLLQD